MSATHATQSTPPQGPVLYIAIELSLATWKLAFTVGSGQKRCAFRSSRYDVEKILLDERRIRKSASHNHSMRCTLFARAPCAAAEPRPLRGLRRM